MANAERRRVIATRGTPQGLQELLDDGVIDSVVRALESGKEADVFIVVCEGRQCIAKVYRSRQFRSFKNDAGYREGRTVRNTRAQRAIDRNTRFGQKLAEKAWHVAEVDALRRLGAAGARVPGVIAHHDPVVIMEMISDSRGNLAPNLGEVPLSPEGALAMYDVIIEQVVIMLQNDLIHGDLSPFNVLVGKDGPVIIDLPQCVSAAHNVQANRLLERDVRAITRHLGVIEPSIADLDKHAWQLWAEYERGTLEAGFRPDPEKERPTEVGDLAGLAEFIQTTKRDADLERRAAEGDEDAKALLRAAERREARAQRAADARAAAVAEAEAKAAPRGGGKRPKSQKGGGKAGPVRRRRRSAEADEPAAPAPEDRERERDDRDRERQRGREEPGRGRARRRGRGRSGGADRPAESGGVRRPSGREPRKGRETPARGASGDPGPSSEGGSRPRRRRRRRRPPTAEK